MNKSDLIVVTGAAGFIGSCLVSMLNRNGFKNLILVDDFSRREKFPNLEGKEFKAKIDRILFLKQIKNNTFSGKVAAIFHLGAKTDTTEFDWQVFQFYNIDYSKAIWQYSATHQIPLVYASSAATYGNGALGYKDDSSIISRLKPLNPYGESKNDFDIWALAQDKKPPFYAGVKFFNVYGPNEYHKHRMASVVMNAFDQYRSNGGIKLFRSHNPHYADGGQMRDFVYVKDVVKICFWLMENQPESGLYNIGTGKARTFLDQMKAMFAALEVAPSITYIDTPQDIRDKYQYFTEADITRLRAAGYREAFYSLEDGIGDYVKNYLEGKRYY